MFLIREQNVLTQFLSKDLYNMLCEKVGSMQKVLFLSYKEGSSWGKVGNCAIELQAEIADFSSKNTICFFL